MKKLFPFLFLAFFLASCSTTQKVTIPAITEQEKVEQTVQLSTIKANIGFLASDELAGRDTPSPELNIAARYLASTLERFGVQIPTGMDSYLQPVPMKKTTPATAGAIGFGDYELKLVEDFLVLNGENGVINAPVIFLNRGSEADFTENEVEGKIVLVIAGQEGETNPQQWFYSGQEKVKRAKAQGAVGLLEIYNSPNLPWNFLTNYLHAPQTVVDKNVSEDKFLHLWLNGGNSQPLQFLKENDNTATSITIEGADFEKIETYNIVGVLPGTDPELKNEYIMYSAHYDHVGVGRPDARGDTIYNGARDNAVGTVTVLSAAENIAQYPTKRSALFVLFTGEEKGLLGSAWFADHPPFPLNKVIYCFNSDNGGYNDTTRATIIGLTRTGAQPLIEKACSTFGLMAAEDSAPEQGLFDRSDNVNFAKKGVPAPTFSLGFTAFDEEINRYYHQPGDEPNTLNYNYLLRFFRSYVLACRLIADSEQSLFWNEGDKYYEAGKKLYGKD